jgi:hypothetical protein
LEQKQWVDDVKADMQALREAADILIKARNAVEAWDMTRKQANKFCMQYFSAALERNDKEE